MTAKRNLKVMRNAFTFSTLKKVACVMVAMLSIAILTSCSKETANHHPAAASKKIAHTEDQTVELGHTNAWWDGSAITATEKNINCRAEQDYTCKDTLQVKFLGAPVNQEGDVITNPDGSLTISFSDEQIVNITEMLIANGINIAVPVSFNFASLENIDDRHERVNLHFNVNWSMFTNMLPEASESSVNGKTEVILPYIHEVEAAPEETEYKRFLELDFEPGSVGADMRVEAWQGSTLLEKAGHYGEIASWGQYDPQVTSISVTGTNFVNKDELGVNKRDEATDKDLPGLGDGGKYTRKCIRHTSETFSDEFPSEGGTKPIRGQLDVWVYSFECELSDGHKETFSIEFEIVSVKNEVDPTTNTYERIIQVKVNGQVVDTMSGKVQLVF